MSEIMSWGQKLPGMYSRDQKTFHDPDAELPRKEFKIYAENSNIPR